MKVNRKYLEAELVMNSDSGQSEHEIIKSHAYVSAFSDGAKLNEGIQWQAYPENKPEPGERWVLVLDANTGKWDRSLHTPYGYLGGRLKNITHFAEINLPTKKA